MDVVTDVARVAERFVTWDQHPSAFDLMRVDLTRDMSYDQREQFDAFIEGQRLATVSFNPAVETWQDEGGFTNLRRGRGSRWRFSIYDKQSEMYAQAASTRPGPDRDRLQRLALSAEGTLRTELLLRRPVLKEQKLGCLRDLTAGRVENLHRRYFHRVGLDSEVRGLDAVKAIAILADKEDYQKLPAVLGMLQMEALDLPVPMSEPTKLKYDRVAKRLDLSAADLVDRKHPSIRLDYDAGRLVDGTDHQGGSWREPERSTDAVSAPEPVPYRRCPFGGEAGDT
ncbi:MAG TPA: hypothetical protein VK988_03025 [Acidimicrobiales bacterium]|nr:hypothetical protein [Acidimicrobiales bacterium]